MAAAEADVESVHEGFFLEALGGTVGHAGVEIPDIPAIGDRHIAFESPAFDEHETVIAKQAVPIRVTDEDGKDEVLRRPFDMPSGRRDREVMRAIPLPQPRKALIARSRTMPAEIRSACCRPCRSRRRARERAASAFPRRRANGTIDERRAPRPGLPTPSAYRPTVA